MVELVPTVVQRVGAALGKNAVSWQRPECGLSAAERWVVRFEDGTGVFVKAATEARTAGWLENERDALTIAGQRFAPALVGWLDGDLPVLVTEDLTGAYWPAGTGTVHWRAGDMEAVLAELRLLQTVPAGGRLRPVGLPPARWDTLLGSGALVEAGLCTRAWAAAHGSVVTAAEALPVAGGDCLVHGDVRSDNLCLQPDGRIRLVDWAHAGVGSPHHDLVTFLPTLRLEGGPRPSSVLAEPAGLITRMAGGTVARAVGRQAGPDWLREVMFSLALISLGWVCDILDLAPPDGARCRSAGGG